MSLTYENSGFHKEILSKNLAVLDVEQAMLIEEKALLLQEYLNRMDISNTSFRNAANQIHSLYRVLISKGAIKPTSLDEKAYFAEYLADRFTTQEVWETVGEFRARESLSKIACWSSNRYSVLAFDRFSERFPKSEQMPAESFSHVCELLGQGKCDLGIIPVENSFDGRLNRFYKMIDKHELKICAVCDVEDEKEEEFTRFALIGNCFCRFEDASPLLVEVTSVSSPVGRTLELAKIAELFDLTVVQYSSTALYYRENVVSDSITFSMPQDKALLFFVYLYLFGKDTNILGTYIQI